MRAQTTATLVLAALVAIPAFAGVAPAAKASPASSAPPQIIHVYTRRVCSVLEKTIKPAIGMILQNDQTIAKSPKLFSDYNFAMGYGSQGSQDMAVLRMENLVSPLVDNILAAQKMLGDPNVFPAVAKSEDDRRALRLRDGALRTLASQEAALDIINGFVATQQLSEMQHEGMGFIHSIDQPDVKGASQQGPPTNSIISGLTPSDNPGAGGDTTATLMNAGLAPNPYELDLTRIPGLTLGFNPVTHLKDGIVWTQGNTKTHEDDLSKDVFDAIKSCSTQSGVVAPSPAP
ncbi:MAG: hypothetical protein M3R51_03705 [Candidatus Eremiobacteraeota bacterium]|nr:hypothetical protein [Candidatus Eremiobacteraeota bacterium]